MVPVIKQESSDHLGHLACLLSLSLLKVAAPLPYLSDNSLNQKAHLGDPGA